MVKEKKAEIAPALTIEEFCSRLSESDRRVELISGFCSTEKSNGVISDQSTNFSARYLAFVNKPA